MPAHPTTRPRPRRPRRVLALLAALTAVAALAVPTSGALAADASAEAAANAISVTPLTNIEGLPQAAGTPKVLIDTADVFKVEVTLAAVYSTRDATALVLSSANGVLSATAPGSLLASVPAGQTTVTFTGLRLAVDNAVVLTVRPVDRKVARELGSGSSLQFDVVTDTELRTIPAGPDALVVTKTPGVACQPTPEVPTCVDVLLPAGLASDNVFFSTGTCEGLGCKLTDTVLQVLADLGTLYSKEQPATLVVKCDKTLCGGGSIQKNVLYASLEPTGALEVVKACAVKGIIGTAQESCVDYVQSKRDGSGDTYLYWLITKDARMSW